MKSNTKNTLTFYLERDADTFHQNTFKAWFKKYQKDVGSVGEKIGPRKNITLLTEQEYLKIRTTFLTRPAGSGGSGKRGPDKQKRKKRNVPVAKKTN